LTFGPAIVRWADVRFAHRFAGGPAPLRAPKHGTQRVAHSMREWYRVLGTVAIASVLLVVMILFFAAPEDQGGLWSRIGRAWAVVGLWYVLGPLWERGRSGRTREDQLQSSVPADREPAQHLGRVGDGNPVGDDVRQNVVASRDQQLQ
jgi:hypothetical protein